jgi:hypothetical protein
MKSFLQQIEEAFEAVDTPNDIIDEQENYVTDPSNEDLELEEMSTSGAVGSYMTPNAFSNAPNSTVQSGGMKRVKNVREGINTPPNYRSGEYQKPESEEEEYMDKFPFADDDQKWQHAKFKYPTEPLVDKYRKYSDRPAHVTEKSSVEYDWSGVKNKTNESVYETMDNKYEQLIESYRNFKKGDVKPSSKVKQTIQEIAMKLREIESLVSNNARLKTESGVTSSHYGPSTNKALNKISERLIKISERVRALGE